MDTNKKHYKPAVKRIERMYNDLSPPKDSISGEK